LRKRFKTTEFRERHARFNKIYNMVILYRSVYIGLIDCTVSAAPPNPYLLNAPVYVETERQIVQVLGTIKLMRKRWGLTAVGENLAPLDTKQLERIEYLLWDEILLTITGNLFNSPYFSPLLLQGCSMRNFP
jgi:hypothetical protein